MASGRAETEAKISPEFAGRLSRLRPEEKVRAIVLLTTPQASRTTRRQCAAERKAAVDAVRESAGENLGAVDAILDRFGGERLAERPDVFGSVPVVITPAGVYVLAASDAVKAVLEDQAVHPVV